MKVQKINIYELWIQFIQQHFSVFFLPEEKENAFTHVVLDSAKAIPTKLKTPLFPRQTMTPEPR